MEDGEEAEPRVRLEHVYDAENMPMRARVRPSLLGRQCAGAPDKSVCHLDDVSY